MKMSSDNENEPFSLPVGDILSNNLVSSLALHQPPGGLACSATVSTSPYLVQPTSMAWGRSDCHALKSPLQFLDPVRKVRFRHDPFWIHEAQLAMARRGGPFRTCGRTSYRAGITYARGSVLCSLHNAHSRGWSSLGLLLCAPRVRVRDVTFGDGPRTHHFRRRHGFRRSSLVQRAKRPPQVETF